MVESNQSTFMSQTAPSLFEVEEQSLIAKTGNDDECEDAIYIGSSFVAVIDGASSKTERKWNGATGGKIAALTIKEVFDCIPHEATAREAVDLLTTAIRSVYERYQILEAVNAHPTQRATACFVAISFSRREVWFVGDCQCLVNQKLISNIKKIDAITANARSMFLESEIAKGKFIEELRQNDTGRAFILPLLERQMLFQNNPVAGQYWFAAIDGFEVPEQGIYVDSLPADIQTIVLASDGYPHLKETLAASEESLAEILHDDPLLFRKYKATKGVNKGNISFDDRAYLKLKVREDARARCTG
jgi:glycerophosphoryl diester phosphodiesterase